MRPSFQTLSFSYLSSMSNILEVSRVSPQHSVVNELSLPLTFFDTIWFKFLPVERLFFYSLAEPKEYLLSSVIPKLKHSLSLTLRHFLPLAGRLTWPVNTPKPMIIYRAPNDNVSFSVAESEAELFRVLCEDQPRKASMSRSLVPKLNISETGASVLSLQVTLFPGKGFCIGVATHHAVLDGKSSTMFLKSWAHFCRDVNATSLPPELTPFYDRSVVRDPKGLDSLFVSHWLKLSGTWDAYSDPRDDPKLFHPINMLHAPSNSLRATFVLSNADLAKHRQEISSPVRLSTFVVALSYAVHCFISSAKSSGDDSKKILLGFAADLRSRLNPPVPENYFGNCIGGVIFPGDLRDTGGELAAVASIVRGIVTELDKKDDVIEGADEWLANFGSMEPAWIIGVAGSPRFGLYSVDFGWGSPTKVEVVSIDRTGAFSMAESRDGCGGVEIGIVLDKTHMDDFTSIFAEGLLC